MKFYYKRNLPHFVVDGYSYFITARLANSIPKDIIIDLKNRYENNIKRISSISNSKKKKEEYLLNSWNYFLEFDTYLDKSSDTPHWLNNENLAKIVKDALHYRDNREYELIAYTIMSNHIHLIIKPNFKKLMLQSKYKNEYPLGALLGSFKRYTARKCNSFLRQTGAFWQHENYDHIIRNNSELFRLVNYVLDNPAKVGLTQDIYNYKWSYYNPRYL